MSKIKTDLQGDLLKQGEKGVVKSWKKRFFLVRKNETMLHYYNGDKETGSIDLNQVEDIEMVFGEHFQFKVTVPGRVYSLRAASEEQRKYWVDGLSEIIWPETAEGKPKSALSKLKQLKKKVTGSLDQDFDNVSPEEKNRRIAEKEHINSLKDQERKEREAADLHRKQVKEDRKRLAESEAMLSKKETKADQLKNARLDKEASRPK